MTSLRARWRRLASLFVDGTGSPLDLGGTADARRLGPRRSRVDPPDDWRAVSEDLRRVQRAVADLHRDVDSRNGERRI